MLVDRLPFKGDIAMKLEQAKLLARQHFSVQAAAAIVAAAREQAELILPNDADAAAVNSASESITTMVAALHLTDALAAIADNED
jgi:hypothetical protein